MKKYLILLLLIVQSGFAQEKTIPKKDLETIKYEYNWKNESYLIVNYRFPKDYCPYENYGELDKSYAYLNSKVYSKLDLKSHRNVFVYADKLAAKSILDKKIHYDDVGLYFLKKLLDIKGSCYGVLIINKNGEYNYILGEYSSKDIQNLTDSLK